MIFFGASGHAKVVVEAWLAGGGKVSQILDDNSKITSLLGFHVTSSYEVDKLKGKDLIISIGSNAIRKTLSLKLRANFRSIIHPSSILATSSHVGVGTVVMAGVIVNSSTRIGEHVILNTGCVADHDCEVENFAHISPKATLCGGVRIQEGTHVGAGATIIQGVEVGKWATIGAGAVVIDDVPDYAVVVGVPGKIIKFEKP